MRFYRFQNEVEGVQQVQEVHWVGERIYFRKRAKSVKPERYCIFAFLYISIKEFRCKCNLPFVEGWWRVWLLSGFVRWPFSWAGMLGLLGGFSYMNKRFEWSGLRFYSTGWLGEVSVACVGMAWINYISACLWDCREYPSGQISYNLFQIWFLDFPKCDKFLGMTIRPTVTSYKYVEWTLSQHILWVSKCALVIASLLDN